MHIEMYSRLITKFVKTHVFARGKTRLEFPGKVY